MKTFPLRSRRGSALVGVLIIGLCLLLICGSLLRHALTERTLNARTSVRLETYAVAEAVSEYAAAQVRQRFERRPDFAPQRFVSGGENLQSPPTAFLATIPAAAEFEFRVGTLRPVTNSAATLLGTPGISPDFYYYDPAEPSNQFDPLKGRLVFRYDLPVYAKATLPLPTGQRGAPEIVCVKQVVSVRSIPVFAYAIFYNMDLELSPGPQMDILGNVHTNASLYLKKQFSDGTTLNFRGPVTATGGLYAALKFTSLKADGSVENFDAYTNNTNFTTAAAGLDGIYDGIRLWRDHKWGQAAETADTRDLFRTWSTDTFGGNLLTSVHGMQVVKLPTMSNYVEDPTPGDGIDQSVNDAHKLIEPPLMAAAAGYDADIEAQKYSVGAAIYLVVNPSATDRTGHAPDGSPLIIPPRQYRAFARNGAAFREILLPGQTTYGDANTTANLTANAGGPAIITIRPAEMRDLRRATFDWHAPRSSSNPYTPRPLDLIDLDLTALKLTVDRSVNSAATTSVYSTTVPANGTADTNAAWTSFIYHPGAAPASVTLGDAHRIYYAPSAGSSSAIGYNSPDWNGAIYVESVDALLRKDSGVRLLNGRGRLASDAAGNGLTIATNDALYILGHYNADGTVSNVGTANSGRYPESAETPCSVAADAITLLSNPVYQNSGGTITQIQGWNDALSFNSISSSASASWQTAPPSNSNRTEGATASTQPFRVPYDNTSARSGSARSIKFEGAETEISAAMLTGIVPSNKDGNGQNSGGAHNFPRFQEDFATDPDRLGVGSRKVAIRGSMVALYESRVGTEPWTIRVYNAPTRLWGYNELFNQGKFPPLTPRLLTFRRASFTDLSPSDYATAILSP